MYESHIRPLRHRVESWLLAILGRTVALFPCWLTVNLGACLGWLCSWVLPFRRATINENLRIAFGSSISDAERRRLTREVYKSFFMFAFESFHIHYGADSWPLNRVTEVEGVEHLDELRRQGRKPITVTAHFGNWELLGAWIRELIPVTTVAKPLHNPHMQEELCRARERHGLKIIWTNRDGAAREIMRAVEDERYLNILFDQDVRANGIFVPFFGRPTSTIPTPGVLAVRYNVPIMPVFIVRLGPTRHRVTFHKPILPEELSGETREQRVAAMMARCSAVLEDQIRLHPAQYLWLHRRWKSTPEQARERQERKLERRRRRAQKQRQADESDIVA